MLHRSSPAVLAALLAAALTFGLGAASAPANVALRQVSSDPYSNLTSFHATEVEPDSFAAGSTLVAAFQSGRFRNGGSSNVGWATSPDGGASYTHGFLPGTSVFATPPGPYARVTDPSVAFDAKHGAWLINSLPLSQAGNAIRGAAVIVNRSTDGGLSFGGPVTVAAASGTQDFDKTWITCDDTPTSPHYGSCYVEWDDFGHGNLLQMAVSKDAGLTWARSAVPKSGVIGGQPLAQPNGTVIVPIDNASGTAIESFVSTNGGASYAGPFHISAVISHEEAGGLRSSSLPTAEANAEGKVYVAWADCRFISGCTANDIVFSSSTDGTHWSAVTRIPIDTTGSGVDHFLPGLAVDRSTSGAGTALGLTYYLYPKTSCTTATCELDVGFTSSADGGATWGAPIQLAGPSRVRELPSTDQGFMVGDYLSTSFVRGSGGDSALSVFALGVAVPGTTCTLRKVTSCNEPMEAPSRGLTPLASARLTEPAPIASTRSDHAVPTTALSVR